MRPLRTKQRSVLAAATAALSKPTQILAASFPERMQVFIEYSHNFTGFCLGWTLLYGRNIIRGNFNVSSDVNDCGICPENMDISHIICLHEILSEVIF